MTTWSSGVPAPHPLVGALTPVSEGNGARAEFSKRFDRSFRRAFYYVSRRVTERATVEAIVARVLEQCLDHLVGERSEGDELATLKATCDRELQLAVEPGAARVAARPQPPAGNGRP